MGYIHLMPISNHINIYNLYKEDFNNNELIKYLDIKSIKIPMCSNFCFTDILNQMRISEKTYKEASIDAEEFGEEYQNDLDENGYMEGIELNLSKHSFVALIQDGAFQIVKHKWLSKDFIILTLDKLGNVFDTNNIVYPFSDKKDAFAIVHIEEQYQTGLIKGIISSREDLYPISYLCKPEFILWDDDIR
jgi:hypothetical protein